MGNSPCPFSYQPGRQLLPVLLFRDLIVAATGALPEGLTRTKNRCAQGREGHCYKSFQGASLTARVAMSQTEVGPLPGVKCPAPAFPFVLWLLGNGCVSIQTIRWPLSGRKEVFTP